MRPLPSIGIAALMTVFLTRLASGLAWAHSHVPADQVRAQTMIIVTDATRAVFQVGVGIVVLAFLQTLRLPELELRRR